MKGFGGGGLLDPIGGGSPHPAQQLGSHGHRMNPEAAGNCPEVEGEGSGFIGKT